MFLQKNLSHIYHPIAITLMLTNLMNGLVVVKTDKISSPWSFCTGSWPGWYSTILPLLAFPLCFSPFIICWCTRPNLCDCHALRNGLQNMDSLSYSTSSLIRANNFTATTGWSPWFSSVVCLALAPHLLEYFWTLILIFAVVRRRVSYPDSFKCVRSGSNHKKRKYVSRRPA